jgi:hypothetical protein
LRHLPLGEQHCVNTVFDAQPLLHQFLALVVRTFGISLPVLARVPYCRLVITPEIGRILSFSVSEASLYVPGRIVTQKQNGRPSESAKLKSNKNFSLAARRNDLTVDASKACPVHYSERSYT